MGPGLELGIAIPQTFPDARPRATSLVDYLRRAEALGFQSVWVQEQLLGAMPSLEPVALLTYATPLTRRVRLGAAVLLPGLRNPIHLAKSLATLDTLSGGRLIVGVGIGSPRVHAAFRVAAEERVARFVESLALVRSLWSRSVTTVQGVYWRVEGAMMEPKPLQVPRPPIWVGAHHPAGLRRSVELGDGFIGAGAASPTSFGEQVQYLARLLEARGRDPGTFPISKRVYIAVGSDVAQARRRLEAWFGAFYGDASLAGTVSVIGDVHQCVEELARLGALGARSLILNPVFDEAEQLETLGGEGGPRLLQCLGRPSP
jgi:alkanesulfonate monooxygenase SsuD/methylene tetrahydromethanopterin reductase-like flavin-dependent oxidoreductase (luciferase family)